jgi:uncharacterized protein (DUF1800 family)
LALITLGFSSSTQAANPGKAPVLLSESTSTRAIAFESASLKPEPFPLTASVKFSNDTRTRIAIFAMNLELYAGEGINAFTAEAEDGAGKRYGLPIEFMGPVPEFDGITMFIVRLADDLGDAGDVLLRLNLHGMSSNRVRVAIGHMGGGPAVDPSTEFIAAAPATPPPADPIATPNPYTDPSYASGGDAVRFLEQASWGPTAAELARVRAMGYRAWIEDQFNTPVVNTQKGSDYPDLAFPPDDTSVLCPSGAPQECTRDNYTLYPIQKTYFTNALYGSAQLRSRVAWALHQIIVVSGISPLDRPAWMTVYLQALDRGAFGNYRTLLNETTLNVAMGEYLDMRISTRTNPNENFAREVLQLFSIGVNELNIDGTLRLDAQGNTIPTYSQATVNEFTRVFTGWNWVTPSPFGAGITDYRDPMIPRGGTSHDTGTKTLLNGFTIPACNAPNTNAQCAQSDLTAALDNIFNHPNVGPFIGKQLIQHLVTSNPSPAYVARVARVFNNDCDALYPQNCTNARGNLKAVVLAILLDPEARGDVKTDPNYGKLREPVQYLNNMLRAFNVKSFDKTTTSDGVLAGRGPNFTGQLDQNVFQPNTVFSYYQPEYEVPGAKILGPAFGILSTSTTLRRANAANTVVYTGVAPTTSPNTDRPRGTAVDLSNLEALSATPGAIADQLNALLLHGTMSTQMRTSLITAMSAINDADATVRARKRAQTAVYLVTTSSQYDIQR